MWNLSEWVGGFCSSEDFWDLLQMVVDFGELD